MRVSQRNRLSCKTKVPCESKYCPNLGQVHVGFKVHIIKKGLLLGLALDLTLWFVFKLSICFLKSSDQKSLQINLIASK